MVAGALNPEAATTTLRSAHAIAKNAKGNSLMLVARDLEVRAGARLLLEHASFQVGPGDRIGLVDAMGQARRR